MNWLIDAQLPPRLASWFRDRGEQCIHVADLEDGLRLPDQVIWNYARENEYIIVTKDKDFYDRSILFGAPPQLLFIRVGNCSNDALIGIMQNSLQEIVTSLKKNHSLVILYSSGVQTYWTD